MNKPRVSISLFIRSSLKHLIILISIAIWLIPAYAMVMNSLKGNFAVTTTNVLIPPHIFSLFALQTVWSDLRGDVVNSIIVVLPVSLISAFVGGMGAFLFYEFSYSYSKSIRSMGTLIFSLFAFATFIPYEATLMPLTQFVVYLGLLNTYLGMIVALLIFFLPTGALLMSIFFAVIPRNLVEAARMDGGSSFKVFTRVVLPVAMPGFISTVIFVFIEAWNNFFIPLILTTTPSMRLASVGLESYTGGFGTIYNQTFAAAFIASIIPLAIFIFLGRYFIKGLSALGTGGKGV